MKSISLLLCAAFALSTTGATAAEQPASASKPAATQTAPMCGPGLALMKIVQVRRDTVSYVNAKGQTTATTRALLGGVTAGDTVCLSDNPR